MKKILPENLLLDPPATYLTTRWPRPVSIARRSTSPTSSSISNGNPVAKDVFTKPNAREISACRPWLEAEIGLIRPKIIVCLGATAAQALLGPKFLVSKQRGQLLKSTLTPYIMAIVHPSSILRAPDDETRHAEKRRFVNDLNKLVHVLSKK
jgi:uracil-DNA glycosylase family 4